MIREMFKRVKPEQREQVLESLKGLSNEERVSYLRGWLKLKS